MLIPLPTSTWTTTWKKARIVRSSLDGRACHFGRVHPLEPLPSEPESHPEASRINSQASQLLGVHDRAPCQPAPATGDWLCPDPKESFAASVDAVDGLRRETNCNRDIYRDRRKHHGDQSCAPSQIKVTCLGRYAYGGCVDNGLFLRLI